MFPIIPQYYLTDRINYSLNATSDQLAKGQLNTMKKQKITVSGVIETDIVSEDITVDGILDEAENESDEFHVYLEENTFKCSPNNWTWLKQVHLAEDCHSCNIILYKEPSTSILRVKTVRKILPNEKLVLWFSRDLLITLQIPFLLPNNILSEKQYICHKCRFQCEMPNPIKIHLALDCGNLSKLNLWNRLTDIVSLEKPSATEKPTTMLLTVKNLMTTCTLEENTTPEQKSSSAFKPYKKHLKVDSGESKADEQKSADVKICSMLPDVMLNNSVVVPEINEGNLLYKQAVEMETFVSNLGRFKQGHLCIYCGKVYSRKYGLKIHIRTHTGFKPLKCKFCLRPFGDPSNLNKHVRLHSEGDTPYKCDQCGKVLVRKRDLDRHIKSRH